MKFLLLLTLPVLLASCSTLDDVLIQKKAVPVIIPAETNRVEKVEPPKINQVRTITAEGVTNYTTLITPPVTNVVEVVRPAQTNWVVEVERKQEIDIALNLVKTLPIPYVPEAATILGLVYSIYVAIRRKKLNEALVTGIERYKNKAETSEPLLASIAEVVADHKVGSELDALLVQKGFRLKSGKKSN